MDTVARLRRPVVQTLGVFRVLRDGQPVPMIAWQSQKARELLKILVTGRGQPVSREQLIELLWPDTDPSRAGNRLSVLLSTVRTVLQGEGRGADGPVVADRVAVRLDLDRVEVDVEHFLASSTRALDAHRFGDTAAEDRLRAAETAYGGDFCPDDPYAEWAGFLRDEARTAYLAVIRALADRCCRGGNLDQGILHLLRLLRHDRYDEDTHLTLVRTLREARRHGEAQQRYRGYVARMTEIGVDPAPFPAPVRLAYVR